MVHALPLRPFLLVLVALALAPMAIAQSYPDYTSTTVNDFADLLPPAQEQQLADRLTRLEQETGVELTVVTLPTQADYAPQASLREFATGLFNDWGIGKADSNDGVLILILPEDRAMRLELGAAYGRDWDRPAQQVVDGVFLPAFRTDDYVGGILDGSAATIERIVMPFRAGAAPPSFSSEEGGGFAGLGIFAGFFAMVLALMGRHWISDRLMALRRCPKCGSRGLSRARHVLSQATTSLSGHGEIITRCSDCGYEDRSTYLIARRSSSRSGGSFGGGSSGGGGASGRW